MNKWKFDTKTLNTIFQEQFFIKDFVEKRTD